MNEIKLCDKSKCTQCMACVNVCPQNCIKMEDAGEGFCVPIIDKAKCVKCGVCISSCHQLSNTLKRSTPMKTLACWTRIDSDRSKSSSGGAFSVLARKVLSEGGVVYGVIMDSDLKVRHTFIEDVNDLHLMQGSKYVQSYLGDTYCQIRNHLKNGRLVLFTGTPCQVGGLLTFLRKRYNNLITCDMVCHGVPSQRAFDAFCERNNLRKKCDGISFRFTEGWGFQLACELKAPTKDGAFNLKQIVRKPISPRKAWYMRAFNRSLMFNEACYKCLYTHPERVSDFTMADYWGLGQKQPFTYPTYRGVSMLLVNTERANEILGGLTDLFYEERELSEAIEGNYNLSHNSIRPKNRDTFVKDLLNEDVKDIVGNYGLQASVRDYLRLLKQWINKRLLLLKRM